MSNPANLVRSHRNNEFQFENPTFQQARQLQYELREEVIIEPLTDEVHTVCGVDVSGVRHGAATAAAVVMRLPELTVAEFATAQVELAFPYRSGLLSFRECPALLTVLERLSRRPDVVLVDGQGIAHPRRFGLACHLGVILDIPAVGCAKSRLCGSYAEPLGERGCRSPLVDNGEVVGMVLRTRDNVKPLFVSPGHKVDLADSVDLVLACGSGLRVPEPTRLAHIAAADPAEFATRCRLPGS
ncbi:MAG: deoxyribonuclease V [Verrucomicrobiota bacterium]